MTMKIVSSERCTVYPQDVVERFWAKVDVLGGGECWPWMAYIDPNGYGRFKFDGAAKSAHRLSWEIHNNKLLGSFYACHDCDFTKCCNPNHIYAGTQKQNIADMDARGRRAPRNMKGTLNPHSRLKPEDVHIIRKMIRSGHYNTEIAKDFGIHHSMVSRIRLGKAWAHI